MKLAIVYYSKSGKTQTMAEEIKLGMESIGDVEVRLFTIENTDREYLSECDGIVFGSPVYYAGSCWQIKKWFDESKPYALGGKLGGAYVTADYIQGGTDTSVTTLLQYMLVKGMLVYSSGSAEGQPFIHLGPVVVKGKMQEGTELCRVFGERFAKKARELFHH
jgi:NAD(P)H dehydrogenase (quinone)